MDDLARLRLRLEVAGAQVPDELLPLLQMMTGPLFDALDALATADLGAVEPFSPSRLAVDAA